jgi:hypothetical protein
MHPALHERDTSDINKENYKKHVCVAVLWSLEQPGGSNIVQRPRWVVYCVTSSVHMCSDDILD